MTIPAWMAELEDEDLAFIKKFILASGSLKEVASVWRQLSHGAAAAGPAHSKNQIDRNSGAGPLRVAGEAAGGGRQAGL